jgi:signal transduction histidine kinase
MSPPGTRLAETVFEEFLSMQPETEKSIKRVFSNREINKTLLIALAAFFLTLTLMILKLDLFEAKLYDTRMRVAPTPSVDSDIVIIAIDEKTLKTLDEFTPLPLNYHVELLSRLKHLEPQAIGYLVNFNHVSQLHPELFQKEIGKDFIQEAKNLEEKGTPILLGTQFDINGEILPPYPLSSLRNGIAVIHQDGNVFARDRVTRRALTKLYGKSTFHIDMAEATGKIQKEIPQKGAFSFPKIEGEYFFFRYRPKNSYPVFSFSDVLKGELDPGLLKKKTILIGTFNRENPNDFSLTPFSRSASDHPNLVIHANILDSIIHDDGLMRPDQSVNWLVTFLITAFVFWAVLSLTPLYSLVAVIFSALVFVIFGQLFFNASFGLPGIWIQESQAIVGTFLAYYLSVPYRLIREYKKRWDYQKKNEVLTQVEELKTNFLSLVTHDLKTPIARIQGLSETLMHQKSSQLNAEDKEKLKTIIHSTEELNHFISSILELTKIESNHLELNRQSKDINQVIERSASQHQSFAQQKGIVIQTHLEPLFPIALDPVLMSKVINNLIDNAIKYSPNHSKVIIESKEVDRFVIVTIQDQGIGISQKDQKSLFTKFFRVKTDDTLNTPGTGLGLYLAKYFIELHGGKVEVESELKKGSRFTIELPLVPPPASARSGLRVLFKKKPRRKIHA